MQFSVCPNPNTGILFMPNDAYSYEVRSYSGRVLKKELIKDQRIDLSNFLAGIYLVKIFSKKGHSSTTKVILK